MNKFILIAISFLILLLLSLPFFVSIESSRGVIKNDTVYSLGQTGPLWPPWSRLSISFTEDRNRYEDFPLYAYFGISGNETIKKAQEAFENKKRVNAFYKCDYTFIADICTVYDIKIID